MFETRLIEGTETVASENEKNRVQNKKVNKAQAMKVASDEAHIAT